MKGQTIVLRNAGLWIAFALMSLGMSASAQTQGQVQQEPQPCPTTSTTSPNGTQGSNPSASANNVATAVKNLGGLFHKKKTTTANPNPCAPAAAGTTTTNANATTPGRGAAAAPGATTGINVDKPFTPPADVKIDVVQLAPYSQGTGFYVSPHGTHVLTPSHSGSRVQMIYDGVAGPVFDSFAIGRGGVAAFSADGSHYGYCGVSGDQMSIIVDGKEVGTSNQLEVDHFDCQVFFSPNSKHFYYITRAGSDTSHVHARFVIDGKDELDFGDLDTSNLVFSPDGEHYAAVLYPYPPKPGMELVVDGKISSWPGGSPIWSADSEHLFTLALAQSGKIQILYRDGQQVMSASRVRLGVLPTKIGLTAPPASDTPVAIAYNTNGDAGGVIREEWYLAVNGKQVPGSLIQKTGGSSGAAQIMNLIVNQDGKHYAAIYKGANSKEYLFSDGKRGRYYDSINAATVQFTSGTSQPIYVAANGGAQYLIVGDQETAVPNIEAIIVSPVGDHVGTEGFSGVIDGKPLNLSGANPLNTQVNGFSFTPDGNHYGYIVRTGGTLTLYVDGVPDTTHTWTLPGTDIKQQGGLWTAGSNIAYVCAPTGPAAGNQFGLCLNGKYAYFGPRPLFANLTLTPDASHIFFFERTGQGGFRLFLDGVPLVESFYMAPSGFPENTWEMEPDGRLQILAQDNTGIKRYTITPSSSTSVASLVGSAGH
jgi:hypothetical protein